MLKHVWNLQLFADEGGIESAVDTNSTPNDTGADVSGDAAQSMGENSVDAAPEEGTVNPETNEVSFDDLIEGEYKEAFDAKVQGIIKKRLNKEQKKSKAIQEQLDQANASMGRLQPMMMALAQKYQLDVNNPNIDEAIANAVLNDKALYEEAALAAGMDTDTYMRLQELERSNFEHKMREQLMEEDIQRQELYKKRMAEAEELKKTYPNFDYEQEIQNETFAMQIDCGVPMRNAFEAAHYAELDALKAEAIASETAKKVTNTVKANKKRPAENGLNVQPGNQIGTNISSLSKEQLDALEARALRGEEIDLKNFSI